LGITDPNHNANNFWYQAIGGSSVACIGGYVVDADLLRVSGVPIRRWRIEDFASDGLVLELVSANTVETLSHLAESEDGPAVAVLALVLLFTR
jgi:hypothetical protein